MKLGAEQSCNRSGIKSDPRVPEERRDEEGRDRRELWRNSHNLEKERSTPEAAGRSGANRPGPPVMISFSGFEAVGEQVRAVFFVLLAPPALCNVFKAAKAYS